jgi:hypothetical protein
MSAASPPLLPTSIHGSSWVDRYERLREHGLLLGSRLLDGALGLVVFLRQGMVAWMTELAAGELPLRPRRAPLERSVTDQEDRTDVTRTLASMVGAALMEGPR